MDTDNTVSKYDRLRGSLEGVAVFSKPSTVQNIEIITGKEETYVVETGRLAEKGDYIFVRCMDDSGVTRLAMPPKVAAAIARQRESLSKRIRTASLRQAAKDRMAAGFVPFQRKEAS